MPDQGPPTGISAADWAATPPAVRGLVQEVLRRLVEVEARLNQTSRNSSKPPSSDPPSAKPRPAKGPSGRKSGGPPGPRGYGRKLKPESEGGQIMDVRPEPGGPCGALLWGEDGEPERPQGREWPRVTPVGTEYRRHRLWCGAGGASTQAAWPARMPAGSFGPRVQATVGDVTGRLGASPPEGQDSLATGCQAEGRVGSMGA
jgi:transposase